ncbi:MAG: hypothetical protein E6J20_15125 [Chloroflexi bacterium]|nr:MAG: hypothetical protein E6J20_15125 [Chloroflexota bacterium]
MFEDETPVAWTAVPRHAVVVAQDGSEIGTAESMLGDQNEDIFHGVVVRRSPDGKLVEVPAAHVIHMTERHIVTDLATADAGTLSAYRKP